MRSNRLPFAIAPAAMHCLVGATSSTQYGSETHLGFFLFERFGVLCDAAIFCARPPC